MLAVLVVLRKCWYFPNWRGTQLTFQSFRFNFVTGQNTQTIRRICMVRSVQKPTFQDVPWSKVMARVWKSPLCQILPGRELCIITCCRQEAVIALLIIITKIMIDKSSSPLSLGSMYCVSYTNAAPRICLKSHQSPIMFVFVRSFSRLDFWKS